MSARNKNDAGIRLTESEEFLLKEIDGIFSEERSARLLNGVGIIRRAELKWDSELVKLRMQEAARGCERIPARIGPSKKLGFWPEMTVEFADQVAMMGTKELEAFYRTKNRASRGGLGDREISRIEQALYWPLKYLSSEEVHLERLALKVWCWCEAKDESFSRFYVIAAPHRSTALRRRDRALAIILEGLINDGVLP